MKTSGNEQSLCKFLELALRVSTGADGVLHQDDRHVLLSFVMTLYHLYENIWRSQEGTTLGSATKT